MPRFNGIPVEQEQKRGGRFGGVPVDAAKPAPRAKPENYYKGETYNLTGVPGVSTQVGGMLDGFQHHAMNAVQGL